MDLTKLRDATYIDPTPTPTPTTTTQAEIANEADSHRPGSRCISRNPRRWRMFHVGTARVWHTSEQTITQIVSASARTCAEALSQKHVELCWLCESNTISKRSVLYPWACGFGLRHCTHWRLRYPSSDQARKRRWNEIATKQIVSSVKQLSLRSFHRLNR